MWLNLPRRRAPRGARVELDFANGDGVPVPIAYPENVSDADFVRRWMEAVAGRGRGELIDPCD